MILYMLQVIFIGSLFCCGLYLITQDGMIGFPLRKWLDKLNAPVRYEMKWYRHLYPPLIGCVTCMASIWGTVIFSVFYRWSLEIVPIWILIIVIMAFINSFLYSLYTKIND